MRLRNDVMRMLKIVGLFAIAALACAAVAFAAPSSLSDTSRLVTGPGGDPADFCTPALTGRCPAVDGAPGTTADTTTDETGADETTTDETLTDDTTTDGAGVDEATS